MIYTDSSLILMEAILHIEFGLNLFLEPTGTEQRGKYFLQQQKT